MKKILAMLSEKIELLESLGNFHEAEKIHQQFIKIANNEDLDDEDLDDEEYVDDPARFTYPSNIFFNSETNQPIIHEGKMLSALNSSDEDMPELRGKEREMTGVENITVVRIPADIRKLIGVQTEADTRRLDKIHQGHVDQIEKYPDIVYMMLIGDNTLNYDEKDVIFGSQEDAESVATLLRNYLERQGIDKDIKPVGISISIADSPEEGLSLPELYEDDSFIYSIQRISSPNHPYKCLVHLILPANRDLPVWRNLDNFISDVEDIVARMKNMGYKRATHYQFVDAKRSNEDEQRHFQVRF